MSERSKVMKVHPDMSNFFDDWHKRLGLEMGVSDMPKTVSMGILARSLREMGLPNSISIHRDISAKRRLGKFEFEFKI